MGKISRKQSKLSTMEFNPKKLLEEILKATSGASTSRDLDYNIFYKIIGFKGISEGIGTSLLVSNVALALAKLGFNVCVLDTSILSPSQEVLLNASDGNKKDWFDLPFSNDNVMSVSKRNSKIHLLSFKGRSIVDFISSQESEELVQLAFAQLLDKYDIFLVDLSNEPSSVSAVSMQMCHRVIQVWNNSPSSLALIPQRIEDCITCCCNLEKMNTVVTSNVIDDIKTDWDAILERYKLQRISNMPMSLSVARVVAMGKLPFDYQSKEEGIMLYNDFISGVVSTIVELSTGEPEDFTDGATESSSFVGSVVGNTLDDLNENLDILEDSIEYDDYDLGEDE